LNLNDLFAGVDARPYIPAKQNKLLPILINQMEQESKRTHIRKEEPQFRASGVGGCKRKMMYKLLGYEEQLGHISVFTLEQGTLVHEMIQGYLQRAGIVESMEEELRILPNLNGHYDGVIVLNGERYLLEIKTINGEGYERLVKYNSVYKKYIIQAHCYMHALGLTKTLFLFVNKNHSLSDACKEEVPSADPLFHEVEVKFDDKVWEEIKDKIAELTDNFKNGIMPPFKRVSECSYCTFKNKCESDWASEKESKKKSKSKKTAKTQ
jgi:CRISPR/Cas system-associated exonuclease Cas4 (RecB family)